MSVEHQHEGIEELAEVEDVGPDVKRVVLRQNRIVRIGPVPWLAQLEELDLYDNGLRSLEGLAAAAPGLRVLDVSFNCLGGTGGVAGLAALEELYMISNGIGAIEGLPDGGRLRLLELGANRIGSLAGLEAAAPGLQQLFLGQNRLDSLAGLRALRLGSLRVLSLQSNQIGGLEGLEACPALEELYLSHNRLESLDAPALYGLGRLRVLDVSANRLTSLPEAFGTRLPGLQELWASDNGLADLGLLARLQGGMAARLRTVYLGGNPWARHPRYMAVVRDALPALQQIDGTILAWE